MVRRRTGSLLGAVYVLVGAVLLGAALFAPWYNYDAQVGWWGIPPTDCETNFFLVSLPGSGPVQASCPGANIPNFSPVSSSYSGAGFNSTGRVAALTLVLAAAAFASGAIGGILGVILRSTPRRVFPELILVLVAIALAIAATAVFAALLPGAFAHDIPSSQRTFEPSGPWASFSGSVTFIIPMGCAYPGCPPITASWGPSVGWSFSVAATVVLLLGTVMMIRFRHDVEEPVSSTAPAPPGRGSSPRTIRE